MIFKVRRASELGNHNSPCKEAKEVNNYWFVEIKTLEELITFRNKYGKIIVDKSYLVDNQYEIIIYDYYIE